jgi:hypothetical protein
MEATVAPIADARKHRIWNGTHANLNRRPVIYIASDMKRDRLLDRTYRLGSDFDRGPRCTNYVVDARAIDTAIAPGPRNLIVDLGDHDTRMRHRGVLEIVAERETVFAALVGFAQLGEHNIDGENALLEVGRNLREMTRHDSQVAITSEAPQAANRAETAEGEYVGMLGLERTARAHAAEENAGVSDPVTLFKQLIDQRCGLPSTLPPNDMVAVTNEFGEVE